MITFCSFIPTPPEYGVYGIKDKGLITLMKDSVETVVPEDAAIDFSELSLDYDIVRYEKGTINPVVVHVKQLSGGKDPIRVSLRGVRKLKFFAYLPQILIVYLPNLYHIEMLQTGARIIDLSNTRLISLKIKDPATNLKLITIPGSTESVYINSADKMIQTDIWRSSLDYFYLPASEFFYSPTITKTSIYLIDKQVQVCPVAPKGKIEIAPAETPNASQLMCKLFELHRKYSMSYYGQLGNLRPAFEELMQKRFQSEQQAVQFGQVSLVKNGGKSFKIQLSNNTQALNSLSQENMSADDLLQNLDNTFKMQFIDQTFTMNSSSTSRRSASRSHKESAMDLKALGANQMDQIIEESEP